MLSIEELIDIGHYNNLNELPVLDGLDGMRGYVGKRLDSERLRWMSIQMACSDRFKIDAIDDAGLAEHPDREQIYLRAVERGRNDGFRGILRELRALRARMTW